MLIPLEELVDSHTIERSNILHVGAHTGEEADVYDALGFQEVFWVEADADTAAELKRNVEKREGHHVIVAVCSDEVDEVTFNRANNGQSSSILDLGTHAQEHPEVKYVSKKTMMSTTVDNLFDLGIINECSFMNLDVQGAELLVLKGAEEFLSNVNYIYSEVNAKELYKGCVLMPDLDKWLADRGFIRAETVMTQHGWGDAIYCRS